MFNTWKQSSNSYVVLPTGPPFERPRNGKSRRSSCNPCRNRKIRCTSEPTGCRNCQKRSLDCQYGTESDTELNIGAVKGRRQLRQKAGPEVPMSPCTPEGIPEDDASPRPSDVNEFLSDDLDRLQVETCRTETDWSGFTLGSGASISPGPQPASGAISSRSDKPLNSAVSMFDLIEPSEPISRGESFLNQTHLEYSMETSGRNPFSPDGSPLPYFLTASDTITPAETEFMETDTAQGITPAVDNSSPPFCLCLTTPLDTWEVLTINISSKEVTTDDFVRCQKAAMSSCEALVCCHWCTSRSQDVMLLIDICGKLLETLKTQDGELSNRYQQSERPSAVYDDDDDGDHLLRSLWMARMRRLGRLIARVGDLLEGEQWSPHRGLLQGVQVRFTGVMFGWQH